MLLLRLPAFFFAVWLMYWSMPLGVMALYIPVWRLWGPRNDTFYWVEFLVNVWGIRFRKRGEGELYKGPGPVMFLANHRSWADFFVDAYLAGGRAQMLSRMAVMYVFPLFMLPVVCIHGCIVFKRGPIADKEGFNKWMDRKIADSPQAGLLIYPEGHRSTKSHSLPLKRGMLHYAYSRKLPIQIIMSGNKESVISEKEFSAGFGCTVVTSYSEVIQSKDYPTFEEFMARLQQLWDAEWRDTMSADAAGLPPNVVSGTIDTNYYPLSLSASQIAWAIFELALFAGTMLLSWRGLMAVTGALGAQGQQLALALLSGWCVTSLVYCWDTRLPRPRLTKDGEPAPAGKAPRSGADEVAAPAAAGGKPAASNGSFLQHRKGST